jgi:hypothetical protein
LAITYNPRIVTDGLVLCLDAGNTKSYPGSGTTWTDLSGKGNTGTLTNGPTFSSANGGSIVFDGSNDGVQLPGTNLSLNQMTISSWNYSTDYVQNGHLFEKTTDGTTNTQYSLLLGTDGNIRFRTFGLRFSLDLAAPMTAVNNQWNNIVATWDGTYKKIYVNGVLTATSDVLIDSVTANSTGPAYIGIAGNFSANPFNGRISNTTIYNRALTASEVQQNFNALRGRFGV